MGTSSSYGGPRDTSRLLPPSARPGSEESTSDRKGQEPGAGSARASRGAGSFNGAKAQMTRFARSGGGRGGARGAGKSYVRARGGSRLAARAAVSGRAGTRRVGAFLADVVNRGVEAAGRALGLAGVVGRRAEVVFAEIANALASSGATLEDAAARRATDEALYAVYRRVEAAGGDLAALDVLDSEAVREAVENSVAGYVYHRWLQELGERIERNAITATAAAELEREVKDYVSEIVKLDLASVDVLGVDWQGEEGAAIVEALFADAYALLGDE